MAVFCHPQQCATLRVILRIFFGYDKIFREGSSIRDSFGGLPPGRESFLVNDGGFAAIIDKENCFSDTL